MPKKTINPRVAKALMLEDGRMLLHGFIGESWDGLDSATIMEEITGLSDDIDTLIVSINSMGGYVTEGLAIYNALAALKKTGVDVHVEVQGVAASMASVIAMVGSKITMPQNALLMIHNPWNSAVGEAEDLRKAADILDSMKDSLSGIYTARSGQDETTVNGWMDAETWFTAEQALEHGFIDEIIPNEAPAGAFRSLNVSKTADIPSALSRRINADQPAGETANTPNPEAHEDNIMPKSLKKGQADPKDAKIEGSENPNATPEASTPPEATPPAAQAATPAVASAETINTLCAHAGFDLAFANDLIGQGLTVEKVQAKIIDKLADRDSDASNSMTRGRVTSEPIDRIHAMAGLAILHRAGADGGERNDYTGLNLVDIARECLHANGVNTGGLSRKDLVGKAFTLRSAMGHSTSDFTHILSNVMHKQVMVGFESAEETFERWTRKGTLTDFRPSKRVDLNSFSSLSKIDEGAEYTYGKIGDRGESINLATYGKLLRINRQAIINDDLDLFVRLPVKMGRASKRTIGNLVYATLTANGNMSDGNPLFDATHANLGTAGVPSTASFDEARRLMGTQTDRDNADDVLNISPAFALVPKALEGTAKVVVESETEIKDNQNNSKRPNSVRGMVEVIADARLDGNSTTAWYMAADPAIADTIEVAYLDGQDAPYLEEEKAWTTDGAELKVRIDAGVAPLSWETMFKNAGA